MRKSKQLEKLIKELEIDMEEYSERKIHSKEFKQDHISFMKEIINTLYAIENELYFEEFEQDLNHLKEEVCEHCGIIDNNEEITLCGMCQSLLREEK